MSASSIDPIIGTTAVSNMGHSEACAPSKMKIARNFKLFFIPSEETQKQALLLLK
jgi:hypothetical protein